MALFIEVVVAPEVAANPDVVKKLVDVCPVNIFAQRKDGGLDIVEKNLDECVLCELCLEPAPAGTVRVKRLYGDKAVLEKRA
jgi:NAD-dependent dihydropyrimidine dehydrogenase PreA subunit